MTTHLCRLAGANFERTGQPPLMRLAIGRLALNRLTGILELMLLAGHDHVAE